MRKNTFMNGMIRPAPSDVVIIGKISLVSSFDFFAKYERGANVELCDACLAFMRIRNNGSALKIETPAMSASEAP